ncbi:hypothetical protein BGW80DRAFT_527817 [Lactifluus volemus]|nr:hypothetical protein BGW80DRAFT_527817 [Lactifluus volemus]
MSNKFPINGHPFGPGGKGRRVLLERKYEGMRTRIRARTHRANGLRPQDFIASPASIAAKVPSENIPLGGGIPRRLWRDIRKTFQARRRGQTFAYDRQSHHLSVGPRLGSCHAWNARTFSDLISQSFAVANLVSPNEVDEKVSAGARIRITTIFGARVHAESQRSLIVKTLLPRRFSALFARP